MVNLPASLPPHVALSKAISYPHIYLSFVLRVCLQCWKMLKVLTSWKVLCQAKTKCVSPTFCLQMIVCYFVKLLWKNAKDYWTYWDNKKLCLAKPLTARKHFLSLVRVSNQRWKALFNNYWVLGLWQSMKGILGCLWLVGNQRWTLLRTYRRKSPREC